jgi:hypothetical protein
MSHRNKSPFRKYTPIFVGVIALFLMSILSLSMLDNNNKSTGHPLDDIQQDQITKFVGSNEVGPENINTYSTNDHTLIEKFYKTMLAMEFEPTEQKSSVFNNTITIYDTSERVLIKMVFTGKNIVTINGKQYEIDENLLQDFLSLFFTHKYKVDKSEETEQNQID